MTSKARPPTKSRINRKIDVDFFCKRHLRRQALINQQASPAVGNYRLFKIAASPKATTLNSGEKKSDINGNMRLLVYLF
jgi:hypothetical protein